MYNIADRLSCSGYDSQKAPGGLPVDATPESVNLTGGGEGFLRALIKRVTR